MTIVAALTGGDVDELMVAGRNGVFYDRQGRDWKASVIKVVAQPVSIRQAFWSPYRRVAAFIESQVQKFAASRDKDIETKTTTEASAATTSANPFDIAKFAGIFAAFGLAAAALGSALAAIIAGLFALAWWQIPIVLAIVLLIISTPSMLLAFLTLRRRNLGPLLDANGWAVNTRARINVPFGAALTGLARLPKGAKRTLHDPYAEKASPWPYIILVVVLIVVAFLSWQRWF
jgi:MFS family permease